jgi:hypothetical protein
LLLAKEEAVLRGMIGRLIEFGRCYGMETNVEKTNVMTISREPSLVLVMTSETAGWCGIFQLFERYDGK